MEFYRGAAKTGRYALLNWPKSSDRSSYPPHSNGIGEDIATSPNLRLNKLMAQHNGQRVFNKLKKTGAAYERYDTTVRLRYDRSLDITEYGGGPQYPVDTLNVPRDRGLS